MARATDRETAELLLALAASPGGRAVPADVAERLDLPVGVVLRRLRDAQRTGLVDSAVTLADEPGRERVYWLTAAKGLQVLLEVGAGRSAGDRPPERP